MKINTMSIICLKEELFDLLSVNFFRCYTIDIIWNKSKSVFGGVFITLHIEGDDCFYPVM